MPYCPRCKTEYDAGIDICADCGADLISRPPDLSGDPPVLVLHANSPGEARGARAAPESEGISAFVLSGDPVLPQEAYVVSNSPELDVYVPADEAERAREILSLPPPTDAELTEAAGLDIDTNAA